MKGTRVDVKRKGREGAVRSLGRRVRKTHDSKVAGILGLGGGRLRVSDERRLEVIVEVVPRKMRRGGKRARFSQRRDESFLRRSLSTSELTKRR